jgi:hypothetical protein
MKERRCGAMLILVAPNDLPGLPPRFSKRTLERSFWIAVANGQELRRQLRSVHDNLTKATVSGVFYRVVHAFD